MTALDLIQIATVLVLAAVALWQRRVALRAQRDAVARIEGYCRTAASKARQGGAVYAYRDVAKVAAGRRGRWS